MHMEKKAKYVGAVRDGWQHTELMYEYRGYTYFVTKHNNGYMGKSLRAQHEEEQKAIDERIAAKDKPIEKAPYEGSAQEGLDLIWNYFETGEF